MNVEMPDGTIIDAPDNATKQQVMALYEQQKAKPVSDIPDEVSGMDYAKGLSRSGLEGMTLGYADEAGLGLAALAAKTNPVGKWSNPLGFEALKGNDQPSEKPYSEIYQQMRDAYNPQQAEFERQNPKTALGANVAGGLMTGGLGATKLLSTPLAAANKLKAGSLFGAGVGGVSGAGYAPTKEDIPMYTGVGTVAGGFLPPALAATGKVLSPVMGGLKSMFTMAHPTTTAQKTISNYMGKDASTVEQLRNQMMQKGELSTLADVAGANLKGAAQATAQLASKGKDKIGTMLSDRQKGSTARLMGSIKKLAGGDTNYFQNMKNVVTRRKEQAAPLYKAAEDMSIDGNEAISLVNSVKQLGNEFEPVKRYANKFMKKNSDGTLAPKMSMKELHSLQRELRDDINKAYKAGSGELGGALKGVREKLLESMDKVGDYSQARKIYAGESAVIRSMELGKKILRDDFDEMSDQVGRMSMSEQEGFISGALKTVRDKLMTGKGDKNAATKLASQAVRERLRTAFPDDGSYKAFISQLDIEDDFARTYQQMYGGSQTQPRQVAQKELASAVRGREELQGQDTISLATNALKRTFGGDKIPEGVTEELQRILFTPLKNMSKKDWSKLTKYNISADDVSKLQQITPSAGVVGGVTTGAGQSYVSK